MSLYTNPDLAADTLFHPLADPERRELDPIRALVAAHDLRILLGLAELSAVRHARRAGWSWSEIGQSLGMTRQGAQQKFGVLVDAELGAVLEGVEQPPVELARCLYCGGGHQDGPCDVREKGL